MQPQTPGKVQARLNALGQQFQLPVGRRPLPQVLRILYMQDAFLRRLAQSAFHRDFVLSGGLFLFKLTLTQSAQARPTQDADFVCQIPQAQVLGALQAVVAQQISDFVVFDGTTLTLTQIMQTQGGWNATIRASLGTAIETVSLDLSLTQAPQAQLVHLPTVLGIPATIPVWAEPLEAVMAGKVAAMLRLGTTNTRYKDYRTGTVKAPALQAEDETTRGRTRRLTHVTAAVILVTTGGEHAV